MKKGVEHENTYIYKCHIEYITCDLQKDYC